MLGLQKEHPLVLDNGSAAQCPNNDCGPRNIRGLGWAIFKGSGFWISDGSSSENLFFDDLEWGSALDAMAYSFTSGKSKKKKQRQRPGTLKTPASPNIRVVDFNILINQHLTIEHFSAAEESWIRYELESLLTPKCGKAFETAKIRSPADTIVNRGMVIRPSSDLSDYSAAQLGLNEGSRLDSQSKIVTGQAGTVFGTDGRAQIYLNKNAFRGTASWFWGEFTFAEVLKHEFIHAGGQGPMYDRVFGIGRHDLAGLPAYNTIMQACSRNPN